MAGLIIKSDVKEWLQTKQSELFIEYAGHFGRGYQKKLCVCLNGEWIVQDHGKEKYRGNLETAVDTYNSIIARDYTH